MIAMQYSFTLPADYDMTIIDRRIRDKGPLLDGFPDLRFKAYLSARKGDGVTASVDNLYAPFYVWERDEGLTDFVCGPGFEAVAHSFGRPQIGSWIVWNAEVSKHIRAARFATREIVPLSPRTALSDIRRRECDAVSADLARGDALASVAAFEPAGWTEVRFRLWAELPPEELRTGVQAYNVGHLSLPDGG
jgi:hypothetical protein